MAQDLPSRPGRATVVLILTLAMGAQPVSTDMYLPALPSLAGALGAEPAAAQQTLAALILSFGIAQLFWGPIADRYGRRPALLGGLAIYAASAIGAALAPTMGALIAWRTLQGIGLAAAVACARSTVRDLYEPREGASVMSAALGGVGLTAMASPLIGGLLVQTLDWRAPLAVVALFGVVTLAAVYWLMPESLAAPDPLATSPRRIASNWRRIASHPTFVAWTALLCATWGGLFTMLASSSFVFIDRFGTGRAAYGAILAACSLSYVAGTFVCRRLLRRRNPSQVTALGSLVSLSGGVWVAATALSGAHSAAAIVPGMLLYTVGHGIVLPGGQSGITIPFPESAGTAASLAGFAMMATAFAVGLWLAAAPLDAVHMFALTMGVFGALVAVCGWTLVRRHGERGSHPAPAAA